jgi:quercetin dioxygenase-like cupin family protein
LRSAYRGGYATGSGFIVTAPKNPEVTRRSKTGPKKAGPRMIDFGPDVKGTTDMRAPQKLAGHAGLTETADEKRVPYRHLQPEHSPPEIVIPDTIPTDERLWVPQAENVWFRPLCLSASSGYWQNLLRVRRSGVLSRHRHPQPVHGYVLRGSWRYLEHDWVATEGAYVYEAPGETHTLVVDEGVPEMITLFQVNGAMIYVDPDGRVQGYEDVFTKIDMCRAHFEAVELGTGFVERFIR